MVGSSSGDRHRLRQGQRRRDSAPLANGKVMRRRVFLDRNEALKAAGLRE
jgi:hypothetical protein